MIFLHFAGRKILDESIKSWICTLIDGGGSPQEVYRLPQERLFNTYQPQECLPLFAERGTPRPQLWVKRRLPRLGERMHAPSFGSSYLGVAEQTDISNTKPRFGWKTANLKNGQEEFGACAPSSAPTVAWQ